MNEIGQDTKKVSWTGGCSCTFFHILNREFGPPKDAEERAADALVGGIKLQGHQCGMLWGAVLGAGAESFRRYDDRGQATAAAMETARNLVDSFSKRAKSVNCREITGYDFTRKFDLVKFMVKFFLFLDRRCFHFADKWAPEAVRTAAEGLSGKHMRSTRRPMSCASEVAKKMGASDAETVTVAGFAGGLGLSGNACGALSAAIWMNSLAWCGKKSANSGYSNPDVKKILQTFCDATDSEFLCQKITGRYFRTIDEHTEFIKSGGCNKLIDLLAQS